MTQNLEKLINLLTTKQISSEELCTHYLDEIAKKNHEICAFTHVTPELAIKKAREIDEMRTKGYEVGALAGIPFAIKDNICTKEAPTTCASKMMEGYIPPYNASVVEALFGEGAIMLGKVNMDQFAMGSATNTSYYGTTRNPLDLERTAGGSSGGSAAAVAAKMAPFSLASDTGGSARQPAACCGLVSIKPTYCSISRYGLASLAPSLEQICPMTADVMSNALISNHIMFYDPRDGQSLMREKTDYTKDIKSGIKGTKIAFVTSQEYADDSVNTAICSAAEQYRALGAEICELSFDKILQDCDAAVSAYYIISSAEASSELARFDGLRYGASSRTNNNVYDMISSTRGENLGYGVKRRILLGSLALSRDGYETLYVRAKNAEAVIAQHLRRVFEDFDVLLMPVMSSVAHRFDELPTSYVQAFREDVFTIIANLSGLPALSLPCGRGEGNMPIGMQLMGASCSEELLYRVAYAFESSTGGAYGGAE